MCTAPSAMCAAGFAICAAQYGILDVALVRVRFVGFDDHLDEAVADDILFCEIDELYAFDVREDALGFDEAAALARRKINLRDIASNHGLRAEADARQKHLHLLARRVLRFV